MSELHDGAPTTDEKCKRVMLRAERGDTIEVEGNGQMDVVKRTETYFGPSLLLYDDEIDENLKLTAPGPASQLMLWEALHTDDGERRGWQQVGEVRAFIAELGDYEFCADCHEPIKTLDHARRSAFGVCAGGESE